MCGLYDACHRVIKLLTVEVLKGRSAFPNDEAIMQVLYMGLQHVAKKWTQPIPEWKAALNQFVILFGERVQV